MAPNGDEVWKAIVLHQKDREFLPSTLLYRFVQFSSGIKLWVTDLCQIWLAQQTDREGLVAQASRSNSPIDPGVDESQFEILISKFRDGLSGIRGGKCRLFVRQSNGVEHEQEFCLKINVPLPRPLGYLQWEFTLLPSEKVIFSRELLFPALRSHLLAEAQIQRLEQQIREKDHVVSRLMDKVEQSSIDLSMVFPGYSSGRKGLNAKQALKVVPGISTTELDDYAKGNGKQAIGIVRSITESIREPNCDEFHYNAPESFDTESWRLDSEKRPSWRPDWVLHISADTDSSVDEDNMNSYVPSPPTQESSTAFETQKSASNRSRAEAGGGGSTLERIDLEKPPSRHASEISTATASASPSPPVSDSDVESPPATASQKTKSKVGTLGGKRKPAGSASTSPPPDPSQKTSSVRKLGAIGGRKPTSKPASLRSPSPHNQSPSRAPTRTPSRRLGVLGGRRSLTPKPGVPKPDAAQRSDDLDKTPTPSSSASSKPPQEKPADVFSVVSKPKVTPPRPPVVLTEAQKADAKREELKRTLDASGGAGTGKKKKRRF